MKTSTFENRTKDVNKNSSGYRLALELLTDGNPVYTCWTSGTGRFCTNLDYTEDTSIVLIKAGLVKNLDFCINNDSPRGGKTGNFISLSARGRRKIIK